MSAPATVATRITAILDAFRTSQADRLGISELSRRTALPKTTVHRLVGHLLESGLLERDGPTLRLGLKLFELGQHVPRRRTLAEAALPVMAGLRRTTRHTAHLAVREAAEVVYVEILRGPDAPDTPVHVGGRWPVHATGVGKAMLAFCPDRTVTELLTGALTRVSPRTISAPGLLARELAAVRRAGVAFDREESRPGLVCVASPIFDQDGVAASVSLSGWSTRMDLNRVAPAVRGAALTISRELGGRIPEDTRP